MSIRVEPADLADHADRRPFAYVITMTGGEAPVHVVAMAVTVRRDTVVCERVGGSTRRNIAAHSSVTLVWPPSAEADPIESDHDRYTLIADGHGSLHGEAVEVTVHSAILHRPA